jgi:hypothetical protein
MNGLVVAGVLLAHAVIHVAYVAPRPPATAGGPAWPFDLAGSWVLMPLGIEAGAARTLGLALVALTIGGFALAAAAAVGFVPDGLWPAGLGVGAIASLALILLFFHPWLVLGIAIDAVLLWAVLIARWAPAGVSP